MEKIIIQEEISVNQKFVDKVIKKYKNMSKSFSMGYGGFMGDKNDIIREIKQLTETGKRLLLLNYNFERWLKKQKKK